MVSHKKDLTDQPIIMEPERHDSKVKVLGPDFMNQDGVYGRPLRSVWKTEIAPKLLYICIFLVMCSMWSSASLRL